jgi:hypothetical protein
MTSFMDFAKCGKKSVCWCQPICRNFMTNWQRFWYINKRAFSFMPKLLNSFLPWGYGEKNTDSKIVRSMIENGYRLFWFTFGIWHSPFLWACWWWNAVPMSGLLRFLERSSGLLLVHRSRKVCSSLNHTSSPQPSELQGISFSSSPKIGLQSGSRCKRCGFFLLAISSTHFDLFLIFY